MRAGLYRSLTRACSTASLVDGKLEQFTRTRPSPISIAEFIARGRGISEAESYRHLVREGLVRLSHLITEVRQFPRELAQQAEYTRVLAAYLDTYQQLLQFETREPSEENIRAAVRLLVERKARHRDTVGTMAAACMAMKTQYGLQLEQEDCALTRSVQYCLDRLYTSRISLNMLTNQHLMLHGYKTPVPGQIGVIHPAADLASILRHAYSDAQFLCEQCYLTAPALQLSTHRTCQEQEQEQGAGQVSVVHVPSHIYYMTFEVIKNAMQATVNHNWSSLESLPPVKVLICQSDQDITIKVSDRGGGVERGTADRMFRYLYTTSPRESLTSTSAPLSGLGYGLPLSRLYARYFQGDIKAASYENYGTDIYIYLRALAAESVEQLPIWSDTASSKISATSSELSDWVSQPQYSVKSTPQ